MHALHRIARRILVFSVCIAAPLAAAQSGDAGSAPRGLHPEDRLFLGFGEEAALVDRQWWEGQAELQDGDGFDAVLLHGTAAFQAWRGFELGGRVGFGDTDVSGPLPDGSGATDLDLWGKYLFGSSEGTRFAAGVRAIVPTGDDSAGLGYDAFSVGGFGSFRHPMDGWTLTGNAGVDVNGDGRVFGIDLDGETSFTLGAGALVPLGARTTLVGEARYQSERLDGLDSDTRLLGGLNIHVSTGGLVRVAIGVGLTDGAPDGQLVVGYAATF